MLAWVLAWGVGCGCHILKLYVKVFYVMGRALTDKLLCMGTGLVFFKLSDESFHCLEYTVVIQLYCGFSHVKVTLKF